MQPGVVAIPEFVVQIAGFQDAVTVSAPGSYEVDEISSATKTLTPLRDVPQSITVVTKKLIKDQLMTSIGDVVRYVPGIAVHQGENNRDQVIIRGNSSSADFFVNGVRDDVQYYRDLYNLERVEALKGPNAMIFGRGGGGGVINRVTKEAGFTPLREVHAAGRLLRQQAGHRRSRSAAHRIHVAFRLNGMYENSDSFRDFVDLERYGVNPTVTFASATRHDDHARLRVLARHARRRSRHPVVSGPARRRAIRRPSTAIRTTATCAPSVNLGSATVEHQAGARRPFAIARSFGDYDRGYQNFVPGAVSADEAQVALSAYNNATQRLNIFNQTDLIYVAVDGTRPAHAARRRRIRPPAHRQLPQHRLLQQHRRRRSSCRTTTRLITTPVTFRQSATDADNHLQTNVAAALRAGPDRALPHTFRWSPACASIISICDYHNNRNGDKLGRHRQSRVAARRGRLQADRAGLDLRQLQRVLSAEFRRSVLLADHDHAAGRSRRSSTTTKWARSGTCARLICRSRPRSIGWTARTRGRPIRTIRPGSCRPAASAPMASRSG